MERKERPGKAAGILEKEPKLVQLPSHGMGVFVGDTHGDLEATERVLSRFLGGKNTLIFLGDYVDRGDFSRENVDTLLQAKQEHPERLFLLSGNHEGFLTKPFSPVSFWEALSGKEQEHYDALFSLFPLVATSENGILALHGALPEFDDLEEINQIKRGGEQWERIVWGDFVEGEGEWIGDWGGRPQFGRGYFNRMMARYRKKVLIRSHQPFAPLFMFQKRCVTIFSSCAYGLERRVAIVDLEKEIRTAEDITLEEI